MFLSCQQIANDWVSSITCLETAERLLRNHGIDPTTRQLLDTLEIFIIPTVNPDGAHYAMYDFAAQRKNMADQCPTGGNLDPLARHTKGVLLDRNYSVGSIFDGHAGGASNCNSAFYSGPFEFSEPETRNVAWVADTYPNIKFALNIQGSGGYFTWSPGAYTPQRVTLPATHRGIEAFHFDTADYIFSRIRGVDGTAVFPADIGARIDIINSEAGNIADDLWYQRGILAYTMATGARRFVSDTDGTDRHPEDSMPAFIPDGHNSAMEYAAGAIALIERALAYAVDVTPPVVEMVPNGGVFADLMTATFGPASEPATIYFTTDGSIPTEASQRWDAGRPRLLNGRAFLFGNPTTVRWIAVDLKGNVSAVRSAHFEIDMVPPVTTALVSPAGVDGWNVSPTITLASDDGNGSGVSLIQYRLDGGDWTTYTSPFVVAGDGPHTVEYHAIDVLQNTEPVRSLSLLIDATAPVTTAVVSPPPVNGWHENPTVTLTATDGAGIGVDVIQYRLDGGPWSIYAVPLQVTGEGAHTLEYRALDRLENAETTTMLAVPVDTSAPDIAVSSPADGATYQVGEVVAAAYACTDAASGIVLCSGPVASGSPIDTTTAGTRMFVVDAQDGAGRTRQVSVTYEVVGSGVVGLPGSMRGSGAVPGPDQHRVDFNFSASEGPSGGEAGDVRIKVKDTRRKPGQDDRFDATTVDSVLFSNAPEYAPGRQPTTGVDTVVFGGTGRWDGTPGYRYVVTASDRGEPGRGHDTFTIEITAPDGTVVFSGGGTLTSGNVQSTGAAKGKK